MNISNTYFEVPMKWRYTWKAPGDREGYQIDFVLVKSKFKNQINTYHPYPGFDVDSDLSLLMAKCKIMLKKRTNIPNKKKLCVDKLKNSDTCEELKKQHRNSNGREDGYEDPNHLDCKQSSRQK